MTSPACLYFVGAIIKNIYNTISKKHKNKRKIKELRGELSCIKNDLIIELLKSKKNKEAIDELLNKKGELEKKIKELSINI